MGLWDESQAGVGFSQETGLEATPRTAVEGSQAPPSRRQRPTADLCRALLSRRAVPTPDPPPRHVLVAVGLRGLPGTPNSSSSHTPGKAVFAGSMQLLAGVKLCTGRALTNHPHYEDSGLRERTRAVSQGAGSAGGRLPTTDLAPILVLPRPSSPSQRAQGRGLSF